MRSQRAIILVLLFGAMGCANSAPSIPRQSVAVASEPWSQGKIVNGLTIRSPHYAIHTTIANKSFDDSLAELMEASFQQYQQFAPGTSASNDPLECYVFQFRTEWADFTSDKTGNDAALYLQINRGGYTVRDWYVAYYIGDPGTYAVAAHEGWHQYVARNFKSRLPPFLEEGIATMFENVQFSASEATAPRFDLSPRTHRAAKLKQAIQNNDTWPLEKLITMHAGDVVALPGAKVEAFYAQSWAFAEFMWDADEGKYRPALQKLLSDCAAGVAYSAGETTHHSILESWNPRTVRPMLEHYLGMDLPEIQRRYDAYCRKIAAEYVVHDMRG